MDMGERDMPTKRFYRLSEEKRRIIRDAALHEFSRVTFEKASINQIIKEAGISRGSFYTYFEDKWDVLACVFEEGQREIRTTMVQAMEESGGDIWYVLESILKKSLDLASKPGNAVFLKNAMEYTNAEDLFRGLKKKMSYEDELTEREKVRWMYENYSREKMRELSYPEFMAFTQIAMVTMAVEVRMYFDGKEREEILKNYRMKLGLLKQGFIAKKDVEPEPADRRDKTETA